MNPAAALAVVGLALLSVACGEREPCREVVFPTAFQGETPEQLRARLHLADAIRIDVDGAAVMALVFHECKADYQVLFYRQGGATFERFGTQFTLLDFDQPRLDTQSVPTIRTRHRPTGDRQYFKVSGNDIQLLTEKGDWQPVAPGAGVRPTP